MDHHTQALEALSRSNLYGLLARICRSEIDQPFLDALRTPDAAEALREAGVDVTLLSGHSDAELLLELNRAYTHLFIMALKPMESVNRGEGQLWGNSTVAVNRFMEEAGLAVEGEVSLLPDHIAMELGVMAYLSMEEAACLEAGDLERAGHFLNLQKRFMDEHLRHWAVTFFGSVEQLATHLFYKQVALLARDFLFSEEQALSGN